MIVSRRDPKNNIRLAKKEGWFSLAANLGLFLIKYWAGIVSGSVALIADAWHTLSDSLTSVILLVGIRISARPADHEHPFGHGRAEWIAALIIGTLLAVVGLNFLIDSIGKLRDHEGAQYGTIALVATVLSVVIKEALAQYAFWIYRKTGAKSVKADGWHHRSDSVSSLLILVGIIFGSRFWWMDGALGILVSIALFYAAYDIIKDSTQSILGEKPSKQLVDLLREIPIKVIGRDVELHHVHTHNYGDHTELTCHIKLPHDMTLHNAHDIASKIEIAILEETGITATIHMEPNSTAGLSRNQS
ncbi:MAG: cation transporter [Bacteroidales bacterium]|nr:cation transporter [Bacteroidales bacterium]